MGSAEGVGKERQQEVRCFWEQGQEEQVGAGSEQGGGTPSTTPSMHSPFLSLYHLTPLPLIPPSSILYPSPCTPIPTCPVECFHVCHSHKVTSPIDATPHSPLPWGKGLECIPGGTPNFPCPGMGGFGGHQDMVVPSQKGQTLPKHPCLKDPYTKTHRGLPKGRD